MWKIAISQNFYVVELTCERSLNVPTVQWTYRPMEIISFKNVAVNLLDPTACILMAFDETHNVQTTSSFNVYKTIPK